MSAQFLKSTLSALIIACLIAFAWHFPDQYAGAAMAWLAVLGLVYLARSNYKPYRIIYFCGIIVQLIGFHWLHYTIVNFGNFPTLIATLILLLFAFFGGLQFVIFILIFRNLPARFKASGLAIPLAWTGAAAIPIRIFPWYMGHTQLPFSYLAQIADIGGALLISFLMFWLVDSFWLWRKEEKRLPLYPALVAFILALIYGWSGVNNTNILLKTADNRIPVALVQGNISITDKHKQSLRSKNLRKHYQLSREYFQEPLLLIWPETTIMRWINSELRSVKESPYLSLLQSQAALLTGVLTYKDKSRFFNSAFVIQPDGKITPPYHKQILMPFGEYIPFGDILPFLRSIYPIEDFTAGSSASVFDIKFDEHQLKVSPLICYEDLVSDISREAVLKGAELLVNLTNDAWYGDSAAPYQHHQIAAFRAIENRRFLIRATNSGFSGIVDPSGRTVSYLPLFKADTLKDSILPLKEKTFYTRYLGQWFWQLLTILCACLMAYRKVIK